jgi:hypothetical protein
MKDEPITPIDDGHGRWIIRHPSSGGTSAGLREALAGIPKGHAFTLPPDAKIEYLEARRPRRTLGAWRRKVASPETLLFALATTAYACTEETKAALAALATPRGLRPYLEPFLTAQA